MKVQRPNEGAVSEYITIALDRTSSVLNTDFQL
jgi:hypothetical protein